MSLDFGASSFVIEGCWRPGPWALVAAHLAAKGRERHGQPRDRPFSCVMARPSGSPGWLLHGAAGAFCIRDLLHFTMSTIQSLTLSPPVKIPHSLEQSPVTPGDLYVAVQGR